ncbi:MAG TPA: hypothetical protein VFA51_09525 [Candidatus Udaeobacter sp.]|nr:hypothetical protein [Candidatus Udaeobacter sp.]
MEYVKRLFFKANETAMQLHVPPVEYINYHSHSLHLWRPHNTEIPRPPNERVWSWSRGPKTEETILASLAAGMTFASACRAAGKTPDEITVYLEQFPDFENRIRATLSKKRCD